MSVWGKETRTGALSTEEIRTICSEGLADVPLDGKRILVLIPDYTRHAPLDLFFRIFYDEIGTRVRALDYLIASGTHVPMPYDQTLTMLKLSASDHQQKYGKVRFFSHDYKDRASLTSIGTISPDEFHDLSGGHLREEVNITMNRLVLEYDQIFIVSPIVPHETAGFSGGNKYFFPGIAGLELVQLFHWVGALITNPDINGVKHNPVRAIIERAAAFLTVPHFSFCFAVGNQGLACLYVGDTWEAWEKTADCSARIHIVYRQKPLKQVLGLAPKIYDDVWVGGKVMYKTEPVMAEGGEVIIYAPHIKEVSFVHGEAIKRIGYHVRDYFVNQWDRFKSESKLILAHSTNVRGIGTFLDGVERPRVRVSLATSIPEDVCKAINLEFRDYRTIDVEEWRANQDEEHIVIDKAGQDLYRLK